jgi:D-beta-D-heptose 7-phosphate kinase/D-beta-D-heptose 1-phosphate adenosyltransferase
VIHSQLAELFSRVGTPRIAVVGDALLDHYIFGEVERISPEAPVPVLRARRREFRAGGAGSVVTNLLQLGVRVNYFGVRGEDAAGEKLLDLFADENSRLDGFVAEVGRRTTEKTRHLGYVQHADRAMQQILRVDDEVREPIRAETVKAIIEAFRVQADQLDAVLVSDYAKGLITRELLVALTKAAPEIPFLVDPSLTADYSSYRGAFLICPNRYEAQRASGVSCVDAKGCREAAERLVEEFDLGSVALTMDREGIYLTVGKGAAGTEDGTHFPTRARRVTDVTGAGDMVLSVLGLVVAGGGTLAEAVEVANIAAGLEVRRVGVTPLSREEILEEVRSQGNPAVGKIKQREELVAAVDRARADGKRIVFTNGCFDCLHRGHHHLLQGAAGEGDVLIVAINNDESVRRLKGSGRPKVPLEDRLIMLADLQSVDFVIAFEEDTPVPLLEALRPDVLTKGEEYRDGTVVGREVVEGYGGRVAFVSQLPGFSTTRMLQKD